MDDKKKAPAPTSWGTPAYPVPLAHILEMTMRTAASGVRLDDPEAFPGVVELLDNQGNRTGKIIRLDFNRKPPLQPEYPEG